MEKILGMVVCILLIVVILLSVRMWQFRKAVQQVGQSFATWFEMDTNTLIDLAVKDKSICEMVQTINTQLQTLREQHQKYLNGDRELKVAVTNISHDLRTPLTAIFGYLDLLEQEEKSEEVKRYLAIIRNRTEMLKLLIEELFRYSMILAAEEEFVIEEVDIGSVLEESLGAYYTALTEKNIMPCIQMPEEKVICRVNRPALSRVFSNLLNNAIKYSDGDLEILMSKMGEIVFSNHASELSEVQVARLFDRFFTVEDARKSTGLGLSITRNLVERMGGTVSAKYENERLSISICFPI